MKIDYVVWGILAVIILSVYFAVFSFHEKNAAMEKFSIICEFQKGEVIEAEDERICIKYNDSKTTMTVLMREAK